MCLRSLCILASRPHDNVCRTGLRNLVAFIDLVAGRCLLEESHRLASNSAHVASRIRGDNTQQALPSLFGQIRFFEDTLGGVDVRKIKRGTRVAGVENGSQAHTRSERFDHDVVHEVVDNMACLAEIDRIDYFIVAVILVAVKVFSLAAVPWGFTSESAAAYTDGVGKCT